MVDALEPSRIRRVLDGVEEQRVRERVRVGVDARGLDDGGGDSLVDHVEQLVLASRAGRKSEVDVENATDDGGRR